MTRIISLLQLGSGQAGSAVVRLVMSQAPRWLAEYDLDVRYHALADSTAFATGTIASRQRGPEVAPDQLARLLALRVSGQHFAALPEAVAWPAWERVLDAARDGAAAPQHLVVLDCASGPMTTPLLLAARAAGAHVVLANKDPLIGPPAQYHALADGDGHGSLRISATVGAGLPVITTLRALTASGDRLLELRAQATGSLRLLLAPLPAGVPLCPAVPQAGHSAHP